MPIMGNSSKALPESPQQEVRKAKDASFANSVIRGTWRANQDEDED